MSILFFFFFLLLILNFSKRLIPLISLEGFMLVIILGFFIYGFDFTSSSFFSYAMIFLVLMVIDSVLGISLLVSSCRSSSSWNFKF